MTEIDILIIGIALYLIYIVLNAFWKLTTGALFWIAMLFLLLVGLSILADKQYIATKNIPNQITASSTFRYLSNQINQSMYLRFFSKRFDVHYFEQLIDSSITFGKDWWESHKLRSEL